MHLSFVGMHSNLDEDKMEHIPVLWKFLWIVLVINAVYAAKLV